jgi:uncharacterized membrane protein
VSRERKEGPSRAVETAVSVVLRTGVFVSAAVICLGLALLAARGGLTDGMRIDAAIAFPRGLRALLAGLGALDPASVLTLGLAALIATPFARVAVSIVAFAIERDWLYVAITSIVLGVLVMGLVIGRSLD